jgi:hypothetical protein
MMRFNITLALFGRASGAPEPENDEPCVLPRPCRCCGGRMLIIETFARGATPSHKATPMPPVIRIDTS